jgi:hypothetical protein
VEAACAAQPMAKSSFDRVVLVLWAYDCLLVVAPGMDAGLVIVLTGRTDSPPLHSLATDSPANGTARRAGPRGLFDGQLSPRQPQASHGEWHSSRPAGRPACLGGRLRRIMRHSK